MKNIFGYTRGMLEDYFLELGEKKFKAQQVFEWLYLKKVYDIKGFTNIKKESLEKLLKDFDTTFIKITKVLEGKDVKKFLFTLIDGEKIEAVLMEHDYGLSVCVSSQVGCNMGCKFCESGRLKKIRDLEAYEIVLQIILIEEYVKKRIRSVVIMGIGEPFDNYDNVIRFVKIINSPKGLQIGSRHITISTCGIIPKIEEFMNFPYQVNLAISLHAPNNNLRNKLMPINKVYSIDNLIKILKKYIEKTNRRLTFEYILLDGINDTKECALELASLIKGMNAYVNLIPYNNTDNLGFNRSKTIQIIRFYDIKKKNKISGTIRREFGTKISAACGQLRSKEESI